MSIRDILVFLDVSTASEQRLRLAASIARGHGASVSAVYLQDQRAVKSPARLWDGAMSSANSSAMAGPEIVVPADAAEQRFRDCLRSFDSYGDWHCLTRADMDELITLTRATDLVIIGQVDPTARHAPAWRPEEIVFACGRPVLMIPYAGTFDEIGRRVLVAWDGSREASRALNDALPIISAAEAVTVMSVCPRARDTERAHKSMDCIVRHLTRHGMIARAEATPCAGSAVSDILLSTASDLVVDLIVAGAFHHSPLHEALVGGVSRELFRHMTVPIVTSH